MGSLDLTKVAGTWHSMAMAASDISLLDSASTPLRMYVQELRPTPEDNLEILTSQRENHLCVRRSITARRTEDPAVFAVAYEGERKISVLDTDYTDYMFFCMDATEPTAEQGTVCQYLARTLKVDNKAESSAASRAREPWPSAERRRHPLPPRQNNQEGLRPRWLQDVAPPGGQAPPGPSLGSPALSGSSFSNKEVTLCRLHLGLSWLMGVGWS
ncbi:Glycodelin [Manis javanica]|nr:Glycodelin [Manis javanica]